MTATIPSGAKVVLPLGAPRDQWLEGRRLGIGGSDIPTLLGMDKYRSPLELYYDKRGELPAMPRTPELDEAAAWGHELEDVVARRWGRLVGAYITDGPGTLQHPDAPWMLANVDKLYVATPSAGRMEPEHGVVEVKTRSEYQLAAWEHETPDGPALQAHWYLGVTGFQVAYVVALIGGNKLRYHRIERDEDLLADLVEAAREFWQRVEDGNPPPVDGAPATTKLLAHLYAVNPGSSVELDRSAVAPLLAAREEALADQRAAEKRAEDAENGLKALMGEAELALVDNTPVATWKANGTFAAKRFTNAHPELAAKYETTKPALDTKALAADHPELFAAHRARVLRIKEVSFDD